MPRHVSTISLNNNNYYSEHAGARPFHNRPLKIQRRKLGSVEQIKALSSLRDQNRKSEHWNGNLILACVAVPNYLTNLAVSKWINSSYVQMRFTRLILVSTFSHPVDIHTPFKLRKAIIVNQISFHYLQTG